MARAKKVEGNLSAIAAEKSRLLEQLAMLEEAEKNAREVERDAGRAVLLAALEKTKIGAMDRASARAIAKAIETMGGAAVAEKLTAH